MPGERAVDLQRRRFLGVQARHHRDGVRVLVVHEPHGAVGHRARVDAAARIRAEVVVPLRRAGDVRQRDAVLGTGVELRAIDDQQTFADAYHRSGGERVERELTGGAVVDERIVGPLDQRTFTRYWRHAVCGENARAQHFGRRAAHPPVRTVGQPIDERRVERVGHARVPHIEPEAAPHSGIHRRRARLRNRERRSARRQRELPRDTRGVEGAALPRDELGHRIAVVEKTDRQRVIHPADLQRRGLRGRDDRHAVRAPFAGRCRIGTRIRVVRRFLVVERVGEGQTDRSGRHRC